MAGAVFGALAVSLFVAGAVFGEIWVDSRSAKCCNFQYKMRCRGGKSKLCERTGSVLQFHGRIMVGSWSNRPRIGRFFPTCRQNCLYANGRKTLLRRKGLARTLVASSVARDASFCFFSKTFPNKTLTCEPCLVSCQVVVHRVFHL